MAIPLLPSCETTEISGSSHYTCPPASTHVLDVAHGSPASGTEVHLGMWKGTHQHPSFTNRESTDWTLIVSMMTNADGCSGPLMGIVDHITPGFNRISFNTGKHAPSGVFPHVSLVFQVEKTREQNTFVFLCCTHPFQLTDTSQALWQDPVWWALLTLMVFNSASVLVEECGFTRILTLNRPRQLNALSAPMIMKLLKLFVAYEKDSDVKLLIMKGNGRAFSAGGDVAAVARSVTQGQWALGTEFLGNQYTLNYIIATYGKPQVSILDGIVMGGGAGVSIHGRFRVVTEKTVFAMPETSLGFFPDVGSSYFLSRLPGFFGEYVGLTGARLDGAEMLACGLATHFVPSTNLAYPEDLLTKVETSDPFVICASIDRFSQMVPLKTSSAYNRLDMIDKCFSKETVEDIVSALIREGRLQGVDRCLTKEFRLCCHILRLEASKDFLEGFRAILADKDRNPEWEPSRLDLVERCSISILPRSTMQTGRT